ncbi:hypothetical protein C7I85_16600 [Mesorhizobium soli]|uniref:Uncharacterized protein n=2 Tax=Pseudaminobacter soli (ex Li et al. 2025) TaxID=1295366 RepID=A0A2P7S9X6_9HYPH|nr:hypothetical protein C7I85_16600 [Mesorhizobium soli]
MFLFKDGVVSGADAGGGTYDGTFSPTQDGLNVDAIIKFSLSIGNQSITGASAMSEPITIDVPLRLPVRLDREDTFRIDTLIGPINAKFQKLREL